jgi:type II secretory pathway component PulF
MLTHNLDQNHDKKIIQIEPKPGMLLSVSKVFLRHFLVVLAFTLFFLFIVPSFEERFDNENWRLPPPTLLTIALSRLFVNYWYLLVLLLPIYFCTLCAQYAIEKLLFGRAIIWPVFFWLTVALCTLVVTAGLTIPFIQRGTF